MTKKVQGKSFFDYSDKEKKRILEKAVIEGGKEQLREMKRWELLERLNSRWTQYQWENEHQIDWKSVCLGLGCILLLIYSALVFAL